MWAVTTYYNPAGFLRRLANVRVFRRHLELSLLAVDPESGVWRWSPRARARPMPAEVADYFAGRLEDGRP